MNHHQQAWFAASAHDDEALLSHGVVWIWNHKRTLIMRYRFGFLERDTVFRGIARRFIRIPLERNQIHFEEHYIVLLKCSSGDFENGWQVQVAKMLDRQ